MADHKKRLDSSPDHDAIKRFARTSESTFSNFRRPGLSHVGCAKVAIARLEGPLPSRETMPQECHRHLLQTLYMPQGNHLLVLPCFSYVMTAIRQSILGGTASITQVRVPTRRQYNQYEFRPLVVLSQMKSTRTFQL